MGKVELPTRCPVCGRHLTYRFWSRVGPGEEVKTGADPLHRDDHTPICQAAARAAAKPGISDGALARLIALGRRPPEQDDGYFTLEQAKTTLAEMGDELRRLRSLLKRVYPYVADTPGTEALRAELERTVREIETASESPDIGLRRDRGRP